MLSNQCLFFIFFHINDKKFGKEFTFDKIFKNIFFYYIKYAKMVKNEVSFMKIINLFKQLHRHWTTEGYI